MGSLRVLVAGGTGLVGGAIVRGLAASPAVREIVVTSRSERRLATLAAGLQGSVDVRPLALDAAVMLDAEALRAAIARAVPSLDVAIASLGAGEPDGRRFSALSRSAFDAAMAEMLGTHVAFANAVLPLLADDGLYLGIGGGAAYDPMRGGGAVSVAAAAQAMMTRVLAAENDRPAVRIRELIVDALVLPPGRRTRAATIAPSEIGRVVEELVRTGSSTRSRIQIDGPILRMRPLD